MKDRAYETVKNPKYDGNLRGLASMANKLSWQENKIGGKCKWIVAAELHKLVINKFNRLKVYVRFKGKVWSTDIAKIGSLFSFDCGVKQLLCVIAAFTKNA